MHADDSGRLYESMSVVSEVCSRRILPTFWRETPVSDQRVVSSYVTFTAGLKYVGLIQQHEIFAILKISLWRNLNTYNISHKMRDVKGYLSRKQSDGGPLASDWVSLGELYEKRWGLFDFLTVWWTQLIHWDCLVMSAC